MCQYFWGIFIIPKTLLSIAEIFFSFWDDSVTVPFLGKYTTQKGKNKEKKISEDGTATDTMHTLRYVNFILYARLPTAKKASAAYSIGFTYCKVVIVFLVGFGVVNMP